MQPDMRVLPRFEDGCSYLYIEHAVIEKHDDSIAVYGADGVSALPAASLSALLIGPGVRVTHAAVTSLAASGTTMVWTGEDMTRCYAFGFGKSRSSGNIERQIAAYAHEPTRMEVVRRMYSQRFPEPLPESLSLQQIRGREGVRVREAYARASKEFGVAWSGRNYDRGDWSSADPVNRALSSGASALYGVCCCGVTALGFSPAIGFIHTGKQLSFVYDLADLYKAQVLIPAAFRAAAEQPHEVERAVRTAMRTAIREERLLERVASDLRRLFEGLSPAVGDDPYLSKDAPGPLWNGGAVAPGGVNYGGDDA